MPSTTTAVDNIDSSQFDSIPDTIEAFRNGEFVVILDDPSRENEADLIIAAESITTQQMAFMIRHSSGLICAPILPDRCSSLDLPQMVTHNQDLRTTAYTISVDSADPSVTTGISAHDRALVCRQLADPASTPETFRRPGHVFPLRAREGGVRDRRGHTEAAIDLCRLAGKKPAGVISELVEDGIEVEGRAVREEPGMMRGQACVDFARRWGLRVATIADMVEYLEKTEGKLVKEGVNGTQ
ncbi:3,4-dihydroxy 2-butanone 4-phosphate synthase [Podospora pseudopauciseta]|uniref:3,4-dihydroxy-2-butanone 4-phosphate synthase n=2 Tax=Podospora TaxID=5144 RepID=A0ABR0HE25_9PEZI|nr:3,4-dihydroxy 2-butanone 4-phosphate synthase [Podospora pseudopauciseta]KAK4677266.1 3,4-dihydroxy 2-butanone 4-phosphate synthase [Podospora pseudoanserina]